MELTRTVDSVGCKQQFLKKFIWLLLPYCFALLSCEERLVPARLLFDESYVETLTHEQQYVLFEKVMREASFDPLLLATQILFYLRKIDNPSASGYLHLLLAQRLLESGIKIPTRFILEDLLQQQEGLPSSTTALIRGEALKSAIKISDSPYKKSLWINELVHNYDLNDEEKAYWFYELGRNLEYIQRWDEAISAYRVFANYPQASIANVGDAHLVVRSKLSIYDSKREWRVTDDLDILVAEIRNVIHRRQTRFVQSYMANDFFAISGNFTNDLLRRGSINLPIFMSPQVRFGNFTPESNDKEAWLKTYNWPLSISLWYLYFRRIDYPADPRIDGRWEWAGIFIGELL